LYYLFNGLRSGHLPGSHFFGGERPRLSLPWQRSSPDIRKKQIKGGEEGGKGEKLDQKRTRSDQRRSDGTG
jgi:hypothetical protein